MYGSFIRCVLLTMLPEFVLLQMRLRNVVSILTTGLHRKPALAELAVTIPLAAEIMWLEMIELNIRHIYKDDSGRRP
jgi:hypothetical protein